MNNKKKILEEDSFSDLDVSCKDGLLSYCYTPDSHIANGDCPDMGGYSGLQEITLGIHKHQCCACQSDGYSL